MSISQKYRSYGLRRLNNLSDIADPETALNNILNDLQIETGKSFISQDLDVIRGIKDANVDSSTFFQLASTAETYTFANTSGIFEDFISPSIRLQDKINQYRAVTGNPGAIASGMGPTAWFIPSNIIVSSPRGSTANTIIPNFNNSKTNLIKNDDFWTIGEFYIEDKLDDSFPDENGGILWEGYFSPSALQASPFAAFSTTGLFHVEVDKFKTGNWTVLKSIYAPTRTVTTFSVTNNSTNVVLNSGHGRFVAIGDKFGLNANVSISSINGDTVILSEPVTLTDAIDITFSSNTGIDTISGSYSFDSLYDVGEKIPMRILWWYPSTINKPKKYLLNTYNSAATMLFSYFSNTDLTIPTEYEIRKLLDNSVTDYQEEHGSGAYRKVRTSNILKSNYIPPKSFSEINMRGGNTSISMTFTQGTRFFDSSYAAISNTNSGNYIIDATSVPSFSRIPKGIRLKQEYGNIGESGSRIVNIPFTGSATNLATKIINHNGLVDYFLATSSGNVVTVQGSNTNNIRKGMVCISHFSAPGIYNTIASVSNTTSFTTSSALNLGTSNNYVFVYSDSGLLDLSKENYCSGVIGKLLLTPVTSGSNKLTFASNTSLSYGMKVQYSGAIEPAANVVISSITGNTVTLSSTTTGPIKANMTIVFAPSNTTTDKQSCILPLDLSPPFLGVADGLDSSGKNIVSSNSVLSVVALALNANNTLVSSANTSMSFDTKIKLNTSYRIKAIKV